MYHSLTKYLAIIGILLLTACAGHDRILFLTKTNVGLDVSQAPLPTAEITIARREIAISPTYQDTISERFYHDKNKNRVVREDSDKTLPLLGSFVLTGGFFNPDISSVFAGGAPAVLLASDEADIGTTYHSIRLNQAPDTRSTLKRIWHNLLSISTNRAIENEINDKQRQVKPFYFATDTAFGVKVAWDGTGGPYPTNLKIGYNRTEFAYPPILVSEIPKKELKREGCFEQAKSIYAQDNICERWEVKVPSFFASLENKTHLSTVTDSKTGVSQIQVFATGEAAKAWAKRKSIQQTTFELMAPTAAKIENAKVE